ncbi:SRPBCC family protein [Amycolatopsis sp. OK19-0408]|uniref:SRPBCC family protein n=1 Tax=Amycolatopsis iheyensis TaxID=2945988 RepID=A0A9X2SKR3_9PSEU|nr:SRPBCC family protein [Amycolatopsis iheyensis]MCR6483685.1 SRPBCC family protein [Amycolatopsis iheyensis]
MGSEPRVITATRLVQAPAARVFAHLADPGHHRALDTSGMIRGAAAPGPITHAGQVFVMNMHNALKGAHQVANHVVTFEPDRALGWAPAEPGHPPAGHTWTWRLEPAGDHCTAVSLTYDWSAFTHTSMLAHLPVVDREGLHASVAKLAEALVPPG